MMTLLMTLSDL